METKTYHVPAESVPVTDVSTHGSVNDDARNSGTREQSSMPLLLTMPMRPGTDVVAVNVPSWAVARSKRYQSVSRNSLRPKTGSVKRKVPDVPQIESPQAMSEKTGEAELQPPLKVSSYSSKQSDSPSAMSPGRQTSSHSQGTPLSVTSRLKLPLLELKPWTRM